MSPDTKRVKTVRVNTRYWPDQEAYVKAKAKKSKGTLTEGDVWRDIVTKGIAADKK